MMWCSGKREKKMGKRMKRRKKTAMADNADGMGARRGGRPTWFRSPVAREMAREVLPLRGRWRGRGRWRVTVATAARKMERAYLDSE